MEKKTLIVSILAATLIVLASLTSVVGSNVAKSNSENKHVASPLFTVRSQRFLQKEDTKRIASNYIGKGKALNLFSSKKSSLLGLIDKTVKIMDTRPNLFNRILNRFDKIPGLADILKEKDINKDDLKNYIIQIKSDPSLLKQEIDKALQVIETDLAGSDPKPLGLSTSNPIGCVVTAIAFAVTALVLGLIIGTILIITCLNIGGCLENLVENIYTSLIQGLAPPG